LVDIVLVLEEISIVLFSVLSASVAAAVSLLDVDVTTAFDEFFNDAYVFTFVFDALIESANHGKDVFMNDGFFLGEAFVDVIDVFFGFGAVRWLPHEP